MAKSLAARGIPAPRGRRFLLPALAAAVALACVGKSFVWWATPRSSARDHSSLARRASIMEPAAKPAAPRPGPKGKTALKSSFEGLSQEEIAEQRKKALAIWEGMKPDITAEMDRYQTFRVDKFEAFMKADSRGQQFFAIYKPGTREYSELFEEVMGPFLLNIAKDKLTEGIGQAVGVVVFFGVVAWVLAYFGTDIVNGITSPFTGFAEQFTELYGF
eukprot:TRINITY_DN61670_c0_g1_i1.p1 TRINITY_DN61670_c0_g1~~TRINITY_DN61670_c0_g1_i1.p1  ORF type:complete len:231 (-),score=44.37 TRINITY_DN61670_c0_g1_i1:27-677(-)